MKKTFSERMKHSPARDSLQIESIDERLETRLWNSFLDDFFYTFNEFSESTLYNQASHMNICFNLWKEFFNKRIDEIPSLYSGFIDIEGVIDYVKGWFFSSKWYEKYDFIEFICGLSTSLNHNFTESCNKVLKKEMAGYTIVNDLIIPVTSEEEIAAIEEALISSQDKWSPVQTHLKAALALLSDREHPDYRNSVKESISAVEALCVIITGDKKATLGQALIEIEKKFKLHRALKMAFSNLYGYASDSGGIRHGLLTDSVEVTMEDGKFMLVSCSAFINYLKAKCE